MKDLKEALFRQAANKKLQYRAALHKHGSIAAQTERRKAEFELLESVIGESGLIDEFTDFFVDYAAENLDVYERALKCC